MFVWIMALAYTIVNVYISWRIYILIIRSFSGLHSKARAVIFSLLYFLVATTPISGSLLPRSMLQVSILKFGDWWLCVMIYVGLLLLIFEASYFVVKKHRPAWLQRKRLHFTAIFIIAAISTFLTVVGGIQAEKMFTTSYHVNVATQNEAADGNESTTTNETLGLHRLTIAFVADLHIGRNVGIEEMRNMTDRINAIDPDLVLIGGDIFDSSYELIENPDEIIAILKEIRSKYGTYGVYGNHDVDEILIAGFAATSREQAFRSKKMDQFLRDAGIVMVEDSVIPIVDGNINLAGRKDRLKSGDGTGKQMPVSQLLAKQDQTKLLIVLEHEPNDLKELSEVGADLILAGHTHDGQMFPFNLTGRLMWENPYGILEKYGVTSIVTSGVGLYGPPIRLMTKSEVVEIVLDY